jgi:hypothetical protein
MQKPKSRKFHMKLKKIEKKECNNNNNNNNNNN